MSKVECKIGVGSDGVLSERGLERLHETLGEAEFWYEAYKEATGDFLGLLTRLGALPHEAEDFYLDLAGLDMESGCHFGILPAVIEVLGQLETRGVFMDRVSRQLLLDTVAVDHDGYVVWNESRRARVVRSIRAYAEASISEEDRSGTEAIGLKIIEAVRARCGVLGLDAKTNQVLVSKDGQEVAIRVEYFSSKRKTEYYTDTKVEFVRVGKLFFVDDSHRKIIPREILTVAGENIIFIPDLDNSEFGGNLGYYTCNTVGSLMATDLSGLTILDCGSGSGVLSIAALRLGADRVLGVEFDQARVIKAHKLAISNGNSDRKRLRFLKTDLRNREEVISGLIKFGKGRRIGVVSNLGYWPDYPITNITNLSYLGALRTAGLFPSLFVGGGYGDKETRVYKGEAELLLQDGLDWHDLPRRDVEADKAILAKLNFKVVGFSESESPMRSSYHAGSLVAIEGR